VFPRCSGVASIHSGAPLPGGSCSVASPRAASSSRLSPGDGRRPAAASASSERAAASAADPTAPARRAASWICAAEVGRCAARTARLTTAGVNRRKLASVRLRGPFGVATDSRISHEPPGRRTTYAIVGKLYHYRLKRVPRLYSPFPLPLSHEDMPNIALDRITELVEPSLRQLGVELYDAEWVARGRTPVLRLLIDKPDGVDLDDCARVANAVGAVLDAHDPIDDRYELEVSSPGAERPLRNQTDWERALGTRVNVRYRQGDDEVILEGKLLELGLSDGSVVVEAKERKALVPVRIELEDVVAARRALDFGT
jgi:ribosome maturation factor RimP